MKQYLIQNQFVQPNITHPSLHQPFDIRNYRMVLDGIKKGKDSTIVVAGCIRDILPTIFDTNLKKLQQLLGVFKDYHIVFIENDSRPYFKQYIKSLKVDKLDILSHNFGYDKLGQGRDLRRVSIMARLRNEYANIINRLYSSYDYVLVIDMDVKDWRIDGVFHSLGQRNWDMIGANGIQVNETKSVYYDTFALIEKNGTTKPQGEGGETVLELNKSMKKVMACFGGLGIYKMRSFLVGQEYSLYKLNGNYVSEQCGIHLNMSKNGFDDIFINPNMVVIR